MVGRAFDNCKLTCIYLAVALTAALTAACNDDLGLDDHPFACTTDQDCAENFICHPREKFCRPPGFDAGVKTEPPLPSDAGSGDPDAAPNCADPPPVAYDPCAHAGRTSSSALSRWWLCGELTSEQIESATTAKNAAIQDLSPVRGSRPISYDVTLAGTPRGSAEGTTAALFDATSTTIDQLVCARTSTTQSCTPAWRIIDAENTARARWSVVVVPWTGNPGWWWYISVASEVITPRLTETNTRLIDLEYAGTDRYLIVSVGNDGRESRFVTGVARGELEAQLGSGEVFVSLEPEDADGARFDAVIERCAGCTTEYLIDRDLPAVDRYARAHGLRVARVAGYGDEAERKFAAILVEDLRSPAVETRAALRAVGPEKYGFLYGATSRSTTAVLGEEQRFEAGALLGGLLLVHALQEIEAGRASLSELIPRYTAAEDRCATATGTAAETLGEALDQLQNLARIQALIDHFGAARLGETARALNLTATVIDGATACENRPASTTSLADLATLQRAITSTVTFSETMRSAIRERLEINAGDPLRAEVDRISAELAAEQEVQELPQFLASIQLEYQRSAHDSSRPGCSPSNAAAIAGRLELPGCVFGARFTQRLTFAAFVEDAPGDARAAIDAATGVLLRNALSSSLRAFESCR